MSGPSERHLVAAVRVKRWHFFRYLLAGSSVVCFAVYTLYFPPEPSVGGVLAWLWTLALLTVGLFGCAFLLCFLVMFIWMALMAFRVYGRATFKNALLTARIYNEL